MNTDHFIKISTMYTDYFLKCPKCDTVNFIKISTMHTDHHIKTST